MNAYTEPDPGDEPTHVRCSGSDVYADHLESPAATPGVVICPDPDCGQAVGLTSDKRMAAHARPLRRPARVAVAAGLTGALRCAVCHTPVTWGQPCPGAAAHPRDYDSEATT